MGIRGQYKNKRDANEPEIVASLRAHGITVHPMDTPLDLLCATPDGRNYLVEVKSPTKPLSAAQERFVAAWPGTWVILRTAEEADAWARKVME